MLRSNAWEARNQQIRRQVCKYRAGGLWAAPSRSPARGGRVELGSVTGWLSFSNAGLGARMDPVDAGTIAKGAFAKGAADMWHGIAFPGSQQQLSLTPSALKAAGVFALPSMQQRWGLQSGTVLTAARREFADKAAINTRQKMRTGIGSLLCRQMDFMAATIK